MLESMNLKKKISFPKRMAFILCRNNSLETFPDSESCFLKEMLAESLFNLLVNVSVLSFLEQVLFVSFYCLWIFSSVQCRDWVVKYKQLNPRRAKLVLETQT